MQHATIKPKSHTKCKCKYKCSVPDSCKFHFLCYISTGAYLNLTKVGENNSSMFITEYAKQILVYV